MTLNGVTAFILRYFADYFTVVEDRPMSAQYIVFHFWRKLTYQRGLSAIAELLVCGVMSRDSRHLECYTCK